MAPTPYSWPVEAPAAPASPAAAAAAVALPSTTTPDYGLDWSTDPDLDPTFAPLTGIYAVGEALARALCDQQRGIDLRSWLNEDTQSESLYDLQQAVTRQALADERISEAETVIVESEDRKAITIDVACTPADGSVPFLLTLEVSKVTVALLSAQEQP